ncbi:uncharacterized protein E0L32_010224 [Thyridium curvatum]|uniref:Phytanoyl-CoA dioxygenase n=1 Tax=Thyridium curvatum TaxID=1093900 RepID=A0A507ANR0_9PEZI|nr:uncharacterized protein E0L32_010224 [Thyridium curvatum]TPX08024.1 hypothetical protein E0L32_010224 [Thyridium curvatum]
MATETITADSTAGSLNLKARGSRMLMDGTDPKFGDWRDDLLRDGYAVIKGAIPEDRALQYADKIGLGYDRNDPETVHPDKLPIVNEKGMILNYGACHEDFVWAVRSEPGVVGAFEKLYDTEDLIVSFDAINYGFANRKNLPPNTPWPHQDQDPDRPGFRCLQGLVNLLPNGPNDGGLIVCRGGHATSEQFHNDIRGTEERIPAWTKEWYGYTDKGMKWLEEHGHEWIKVEAAPGDLIVWDSRTPHYNVPVKSKQDRMAIYTCFMPVADASQEDLIRKKIAFEIYSLARVGTTHWPNALHTGTNKTTRNGKPDFVQRDRPLNDPVLSERAFKLTGIPYIRAQ